MFYHTLKIEQKIKLLKMNITVTDLETPQRLAVGLGDSLIEEKVLGEQTDGQMTK